MRRKWAIYLTTLILASFPLSCGEDEDALLITDLQKDLELASGTIDSLNYQVDSINLLLDEARIRADSLQGVDDKLVANMQVLNKEVKKFRSLYNEQMHKNKELATTIERLQLEKRADRQAIAGLRTEADSLNSALLDAHTSIRRQSDHIRQLEFDLAQSQDDLEELRRAQIEVRLLVATEDFLKENGYLKSSRPFGRGFRKSYQLVKKLNPADPGVRTVPLGEALVLEFKLKALVDRYGSLKEGDDYERHKEEGILTLRFINEMLGGVDVMAVVQE